MVEWIGRMHEMCEWEEVDPSNRSTISHLSYSVAILTPEKKKVDWNIGLI